MLKFQAVSEKLAKNFYGATYYLLALYSVYDLRSN